MGTHFQSTDPYGVGEVRHAVGPRVQRLAVAPNLHGRPRRVLTVVGGHEPIRELLRVGLGALHATERVFLLAGLLIGKPLGIWVFGMIAAKGLKLGFPPGMDGRDLFVLGCAAGIGFTVALFVASVAFPGGDIQDAAKMGALGSFFGAVITVIVGRVCGVVRVKAADNGGSPED